MKCEDCPYYYKTEDDMWTCCHCDQPVGLAPCEIDDREEYEEEEDEDD